MLLPAFTRGEDARRHGPRADKFPHCPVEPVDVEQMLSPSGMSSTLKIMLLLTVITLAPSILIMTTCFMRLIPRGSVNEGDSPGPGPLRRATNTSRHSTATEESLEMVLHD